MNVVRGLALVSLAVPLAACSWFPFAAAQSAPPSDHVLGKAFGGGCSQLLILDSSTTPTVHRHVRGPVLAPSIVKRAFAQVGLNPQPLPKFFRNGTAPHARASFQFTSVSQPARRTVTSGIVTVYRTDADALTVLRGYGPHKPGECYTNLRVGNVLVQRAGPMDSRLREAISRLLFR